MRATDASPEPPAAPAASGGTPTEGPPEAPKNHEEAATRSREEAAAEERRKQCEELDKKKSEACNKGLELAGQVRARINWVNQASKGEMDCQRLANLKGLSREAIMDPEVDKLTEAGATCEQLASNCRKSCAGIKECTATFSRKTADGVVQNAKRVKEDIPAMIDAAHMPDFEKKCEAELSPRQQERLQNVTGAAPMKIFGHDVPFTGTSDAELQKRQAETNAHTNAVPSAGEAKAVAAADRPADVSAHKISEETRARAEQQQQARWEKQQSEMKDWARGTTQERRDAERRAADSASTLCKVGSYFGSGCMETAVQRELGRGSHSHLGQGSGAEQVLVQQHSYAMAPRLERLSDGTTRTVLGQGYGGLTADQGKGLATVPTDSARMNSGDQRGTCGQTCTIGQQWRAGLKAASDFIPAPVVSFVKTIDQKTGNFIGDMAWMSPPQAGPVTAPPAVLTATAAPASLTASPALATTLTAPPAGPERLAPAPPAPKVTTIAAAAPTRVVTSAAPPAALNGSGAQGGQAGAARDTSTGGSVGGSGTGGGASGSGFRMPSLGGGATQSGTATGAGETAKAQLPECLTRSGGSAPDYCNCPQGSTAPDCLRAQVQTKVNDGSEDTVAAPAEDLQKKRSIIERAFQSLMGPSPVRPTAVAARGGGRKVALENDAPKAKKREERPLAGDAPTGGAQGFMNGRPGAGSGSAGDKGNGKRGKALAAAPAPNDAPGGGLPAREGFSLLSFLPKGGLPGFKRWVGGVQGHSEIGGSHEDIFANVNRAYERNGATLGPSFGSGRRE